MSDINRVPIPYGSQTITNKPKNKTKKTVRIAVKLPLSNEDTCPEYNYKDELDAAKKKGSSKTAENGRILDIFGDDDGDVRRIAMQMEEKYGKGVAETKKKRKGRKDDYADIGMGYDESDSFIDNTDGYDEIIPQNVTTLHGGFYINCGALEFKTDDEASDDDDSSSSSSSENSSQKSGKREADSAGDSENEVRHNKKFKSEHANGTRKSLKKKLFSPNKILKKRNSSEHKKTVRDLLKEKRKDLDLTVTDYTDDNKSVFEDDENNLENNKKAINSITDAIESVVKASDEPASKADSKDKVSSQTIEDVNKLVQLPESLPNNILEVINKIKLLASNITGSNVFTDEMNNILLSLEKKCKCLGKPSKTKVYENLSYFMKIEKKILMQHCNQLALKDEEKKIQSILQKLKLEIDKVMPSIITNYEKECEVVLEKRNLLQQYPDDNEKRRSIGRPKRKFRWDDQTKKYLKDVVTIKKRSYLQQGNSKELWENELINFLKNNVLHLWPEGWMTMTTLTKVCTKLFSDTKTVPSPTIKKESKNTASNTNNISTTPSVMSTNVHNKVAASKNEDVKEEKPQENHSEKNTFYKIEFEKVQPNQLTNSKPKEMIPDLLPKLPNVNIIELDDLNSIQKARTKQPFDFGFNLLKKTQSSETIGGNCSREKSIIRNDKKENTVENPFMIPPSGSDSDDIQKVMERLRNLQEMSSPLKSFGNSHHQSQKNSSVIKTNTIDLVNTSFQDEFQKQLYTSTISNLASNNSSKNYKCS